MKESKLTHNLLIFGMVILNAKTANPAKTFVRKILRTRNCRRKFINNLLPEKRKENMETKQTQFISRLKYSSCRCLTEL